MSRSPKDIATEFLNMVVAGNIREAFRIHTDPTIKHHNPWFKGDPESLMTAMEENASRSPGLTLQIKRAIEENDHVAIFSHIRQNPDDRGHAVVHIFRFHRGLIAEMWDVGQEIPPDSPNKHGMF
jgi:predicted SnoaL-like aldol condensation-catalyzing enzyme